MTPDDIRAKFLKGVQNVAAVSLAIGHPTLVSVPHSIANAFKNLLAIAVEANIEMKEAEKVKNFLFPKYNSSNLPFILARQVLQLAYYYIFQIKEFLADPSKFAAPAAATTATIPSAPSAESEAPSKKEEAKKEESSEDEDMGFGLFDW